MHGLIPPQVEPPFPLRWGFSTRHTDPALLPPRRLQQVHGCEVVEADPFARDAVEADGLWTLERGLPLGVRTADCVPILLAGLCAQGPWIAALHAGWRGAVGGIQRRAVARFAELDGHPGTLAYAFGPCIQACHFEVGPEVVDAARRDPAWREELATSGPAGRPHLDLHGLLRAQAQDLGLDPAKDGSVARCTVCEPDVFFSYRCGERTGRQWGVIERI